MYCTVLYCTLLYCTVLYCTWVSPGDDVWAEVLLLHQLQLRGRGLGAGGAHPPPDQSEVEVSMRYIHQWELRIHILDQWELTWPRPPRLLWGAPGPGRPAAPPPPAAAAWHMLSLTIHAARCGTNQYFLLKIVVTLQQIIQILLKGCHWKQIMQGRLGQTP